MSDLDVTDIVEKAKKHDFAKTPFLIPVDLFYPTLNRQDAPEHIKFRELQHDLYLVDFHLLDKKDGTWEVCPKFPINDVVDRIAATHLTKYITKCESIGLNPKLVLSKLVFVPDQHDYRIDSYDGQYTSMEITTRWAPKSLFVKCLPSEVRDACCDVVRLYLENRKVLPELLNTDPVIIEE